MKFNPELLDQFGEQKVRSYKKSNQMKCTASEMLSVLPIIVLFCMSEVIGTVACTTESCALIALGDLVDALQGAAFGFTTPDELRCRVRALLRYCYEAGWRNFMVPKFHWLHHYARHLARFGFLPTCWVHERKHRFIKRYADDISDLKAFSKATLAEVLSHQLHSLQQPEVFSLHGFRKTRKADKRLASDLLNSLGLPLGTVIMAASELNLEVGKCSAGDVALISSAEDGHKYVAGEIICFLDICGHGCFAMINLWQKHFASTSGFWVEWRKLDEASLVTADLLLSSVYWVECAAPGIVRTIVPCQYRCLKALDA